jgi:hypothetical protein
VQTLEILQVAIEERVLVVPLDLAADSSNQGRRTDMVHLVGSRLLLHAVDDLGDHEVVLPPAKLGKRVACALREPRLATAGTDDFGDRQRKLGKHSGKLFQLRQKLARQDRLRV